MWCVSQVISDGGATCDCHPAAKDSSLLRGQAWWQVCRTAPCSSLWLVSTVVIFTHLFPSGWMKRVPCLPQQC